MSERDFDAQPPPCEEPWSPLHPRLPNHGLRIRLDMFDWWVVPSGLNGDKLVPPDQFWMNPAPP